VNRHCIRITVQLTASLVWILPTPLASQSPGVRSTQPLAHGRQTFAQYCSSCHSARDSTSLVGPSLKGYYSAHQQRSADASVRDVISKGKGKMPAFHNLSAAEINELIAYLKTL
jgi:mono/diheme cytochrome c family protein